MLWQIRPILLKNKIESTKKINYKGKTLFPKSQYSSGDLAKYIFIEISGGLFISYSRQTIKALIVCGTHLWKFVKILKHSPGVGIIFTISNTLYPCKIIIPIVILLYTYLLYIPSYTTVSRSLLLFYQRSLTEQCTCRRMYISLRAQKSCTT